jgi:hypothetical protein
VYSYRKSGGTVSGTWWACVQAVGSTKDSASVCTSPGAAIIATRPAIPANLSVFGADDGYFGGLFVCHNDASANESGFIHGLEGGDWPDQWFKWGPPVAGTGTWTCQWVPSRESAWFRFRVTSFMPGNSSTTGLTAWEYGD